MPPDQRQEDHDLLIRIHEQLQTMQKENSTFKEEFEAHKAVTDKRFMDLEKFFTLARNGFAFLVAIGAVLQFALMLYDRALKIMTGK